MGLIGLAAIFFLPLALSFYLYYGTGWRPAGGTQHGELVSPARPLPAVSLTRADGKPTGTDFLRGTWHLVYVGDGTCPGSCREMLVKTRQIRLALNKDINRVHRVFLYAGGPPPQDYLGREHGDLVAASLAGPDGARLLAVFPPDPPPLGGHLYLVDPLGNLMMSYPPDATRKGILTDLQRLLKLSHIG